MENSLHTIKFIQFQYTAQELWANYTQQYNQHHTQNRTFKKSLITVVCLPLL